MMVTHQLGRLGVRAASAVAVLAVVTGIPTALAYFVGWPLPHHLPRSVDELAAILAGQFSDTAVVNVLAVALWLVWAAFCHALAIELQAARHGRRVRRVRLISPMQALAAVLVAGLAAGPSAAATATTHMAPAAATAAVPAGPSTAAAASMVRPETRPGVVAAAGTRAAPPGPSLSDLPSDGAQQLPRFALTAHNGPLTVAAGERQYTVTVHRGDTLWDLADAWLGDPTRWGEIYQLNKDRYDQHGHMHGGHRIYPGQQLKLPDDATPPASGHRANPASPAPPAVPAPTRPNPPPTPAPPERTPPAPPPATAGPTPSTSSAQPSDDGLAGTAPTPAATPTAITPTPSPPVSSSPADTSPSRPTRSDPPGVSLTGDSWVDLGLALAIAAAAVLVWRLRRRRYTPRPPSPRLRLDDPDLAPMPDVVTRVRRGLRKPDQDQDTDLDNLLSPPAVDARDADLDAEAGNGHDDVAGQDLDVQAAPPLNVPALGNPMLAAWPPAGLGLTGPGAEAAGRGFLAAALAAGGVDDPDTRSCVVMPAATAATLLGAAAVNMPDTPRLTVTGDLARALELLEEQTQYRTRILYDNEVDTVTGLREANPFEDPLPPVMLIADAAAGHERARVAALLIQGQRLDIHGVLLGAWPDGNTAVVAADGTTTPADGDAARHGAHPADVGRLAVLTPTETAELIATLAESHTGLRQPAPHVEAPRPQPAPAPSRAAPNDENAPSAAPGGASSADTTHVGAPAADDPAAGTVLNTGDATPATPARADSDEAAWDDDPPTDGDDDLADGPDDGERPDHVEVLVLGPPRIIDMHTDEPLRPQALELLVHLIAHDGAASQELIIDDILAAAPHRRAPHRLNTFVYNLRRILRFTGGKATYLDRSPKRCWLNTEAIGVDLWRMRDALAEAQASDDPDARIAALRRAVAAYRGPLADGCDYEWIAPYREAVLQQAIDAHLALADALTGQPMEALAVLEAAIGHAPYAEPVYVKAMRIHAELGHTDAIRTLRRALTRRLAETDTEPADETITLADRLVSAAQQRRRPDGAAA